MVGACLFLSLSLGSMDGDGFEVMIGGERSLGSFGCWPKQELSSLRRSSSADGVFSSTSGSSPLLAWPVSVTARRRDRDRDRKFSLVVGSGLAFAPSVSETVLV